MTCPTCGMRHGACVHTTELQISDDSIALLSRPAPAPRRIAKNYIKRIVSASRAAGIDAHALTMCIGDSQFTICAPTLAELRVAWEALERGAGVRYPPLDESRVQPVTLLHQSAAKDWTP